LRVPVEAGRSRGRARALPAPHAAARLADVVRALLAARPAAALVPGLPAPPARRRADGACAARPRSVRGEAAEVRARRPLRLPLQHAGAAGGDGRVVVPGPAR